MPASLITQFILPSDLDTFVRVFWENGDWFGNFLSAYLEDLSVSVDAWADKSKDSEKSGNQAIIRKERQVRSYHPSKVSFPGLPSHAESIKGQTMTLTKDLQTDKITKFVLTETNTFRGIPYADYFSVNTEWHVTTKGQSNNVECSVDVYLDVVFYKSTWLQGTIESNTRAELITVYELWEQVARQHFKQKQSQSLPSSSSISNLSNQQDVLHHRAFSRHSLENLEREPYSPVNEEDESINNLITFVADGNISGQRDIYPVSPIRSLTRNESFGSEDELLFYDCEEGGDVSSKRNRVNPTPQELHDLYSKPTNLSTLQGINEEEPSSRAMAVNLVETVIVLAQFSYWKAHRLYMYDLKELFDINPSDVISRVFNSFLPGWHSVVLQRPDLYGPLLAVFMLPQALLLCMDPSKHGCNRSSVVGNATVVSICFWLGLSSFYRLLTFFIAPTIEMKHCLSMMGYSFFAWSASLLCSYPLERYQSVIGLPVALPIVLFGIPSAVAQGYMFWEYTPASSLTLQPNAFPTSLQLFAHNNSRWMQKVLWAVPKILAFVIVTGTHYQFLWYIARVFLPGRKQQCELSALMQPAQYADIITQKELRKYAVMLVSGRREDDDK